MAFNRTRSSGSVSIARPKWSLRLLAVLKAGGGYLPLDPALPRERLGMILDDAKPVVVLTHSDLADDIPFDAERRHPARRRRPTVVASIF